jgi:hypothetical protein
MASSFEREQSDMRRVFSEPELFFFVDRFYTLIPPTPPANPSPRTFCLLPESSSDAFQRFVPARNTLAENEVGAHVSMFEPTKNDGYYQLGREVAAVICQAIADSRPAVHPTVIESTVHSQMDVMNVGKDQESNSGTGEGSDLLL